MPSEPTAVELEVAKPKFIPTGGSLLIVTYPCDETFLAHAPFPIQIERKLLEMDRLLDDPKLVLAVSNDLVQAAPQATWNGRPATPAVVTLRGAVARARMGWSYDTAHDEIAGSLKWRWFCRIYAQAVPNHSTLRDREALIRPMTLQQLQRRVVQVAQGSGVTQGQKLRTDATVLETNIHYPTDSQLLSDSVRVLGRRLRQARTLLLPDTPAEKNCFAIAVAARRASHDRLLNGHGDAKAKNKLKTGHGDSIGS